MGILVLFTITILFSYYVFLTRIGISHLHQRLILAGLFVSAQIILTELILGTIHLLYLRDLIFLNSAITLGVIGCSIMFKSPSQPASSEKYQRMESGFASAITPWNIVLFILLIFVSVWVFLIVYFLPSQAFDDWAYHLTPIYEYIINHRIFLLPVQFYSHFSFPENAELLFLWPVIFLHSQQFVNGVQFIIGLWGVVIVYGMARTLGIIPKTALFVSFLFLFTTVVLGQLTCNYIDLIVGVFFLLSLYCAIMFYKTRRILYLYATALAAGLLLGMKYTQVFFILTLIPFLWMKKDCVAKKHWICFFLVLVLCGGYWYARNSLILHTPFYRPEYFDEFEIFPIHKPLTKISALWKEQFPFVAQKTFIKTHLDVAPIWMALIKNGYIDPDGVIQAKFYKLDTYSKMDLPETFNAKKWQIFNILRMAKGSSDFNAGYGIIFWGLALPAWFYISIRAFIKRRNENERIFLWLTLPFVIGIVQLLMISLEALTRCPRYSLYIVPLGYLTLGAVLTIFDRNIFFKRAVQSVCIIFSFLTVLHWMGPVSASHLKNAMKDFEDGKYMSKYAYLDKKRSYPQAWALLDFLTMGDPHGLSCYVSMYERNLTSPLYGTQLQNRVWNLQTDRKTWPDAFLYDYEIINGRLSDLRYFGPKITIREVMSTQKYSLVLQRNGVFLFIRKDFLLDPQKQQKLAWFYKKYPPVTSWDSNDISILQENHLPVGVRL